MTNGLYQLPDVITDSDNRIIYFELDVMSNDLNSGGECG